MWGIIPAAGDGHIEPLSFSQELLPVGVVHEDAGDRARAVCEYLMDRMVRGGARKLCFVVPPGKSDIVESFGGSHGRAPLFYAVQDRPAGFCDALFRALPLIAPDEEVLVGLPGAVWFPEDGFCRLAKGLSFLLFRVDQPHLFQPVVTSANGEVLEVQVRPQQPRSRWVWGAFKLDGGILRDLHALWLERDREDDHFGTLVNAYLASGGEAHAVPAGQAYVDTGTLHGYRQAMELLQRQPTSPSELQELMH